jgi:hypothetical protein
MRISVFRQRNQKLSVVSWYSIQDSLCVCLDIRGLKEEWGFEHKAEEWQYSFI